MAITRAQLLKELLPGLNALFGLEYEKYENEHAEIYETETSERSFEEEVKLSGFGAAPVKPEGSAISFDSAQESFTARYNHETVAMGLWCSDGAVRPAGLRQQIIESRIVGETSASPPFDLSFNPFGPFTTTKGTGFNV